MTELKPCPFCGAIMDVDGNKVYHPSPFWRRGVFRACILGTFSFKDSDGLRELWNERVVE